MMSRLARAVKENGAPLLGVAAYFYDPIFVEIVAKLGFRVLWIEMEHAFVTFAQAADLCRIASGVGMLTMIRIPDARRENVLKAAECGPDILDLPMADSPEIVREFTQHARFRPEGARGYFSVPRALDYGLVDSLPEAQKKLNQELCLMIQIETEEAVRRAEELSAIPGIDIFIGPADLSSSLGVPGQTTHPKVAEAVQKCVRSARKHGKLIAVGSPIPDLQFWADQGIDVLFCGNDVALSQNRGAEYSEAGHHCNPKSQSEYFSTMMLKKLSQTDLNVSRLSFGTMTFGKPADQETSTQMVDQCIEAGINFFDTANMYQLGVAETMLGEALKGKRKGNIIASKVRFKMGEGPDESGLSKKAILKAVEESLKRLQTDYLDVYYLHFPDYAVPIEETLDAMELLVKAGKIRYPATSNYAAWQQTHMLWIAEKRSYKPAVITQSMYNLLARGIEQEWLPMTKHFGLSNIVYNPLAGGMLTGKHQMQVVTPGTRFDNNKLYQDRYWRPQYFAAVEKLKAIAKKSGRSLVSIALNWALHHTPTDCVILGASRPEQLAENLAACEEGPLSEETVKACDEVWQEFRGPVPAYNR